MSRPMPGNSHRRQDAGHRTFVRRLIVILAAAFAATAGFPGVSAAGPPVPPLRLKMELMAARNRSSGPLPVRIRLEYNEPQLLEGDLELSIYDAINVVSRDDLLATLTHEGIALLGQDYEFRTLLPPLRMPHSQNWAVEAVFVTKDGTRIPLSAIPQQVTPSQPHDLLRLSPMERGVLTCSCAVDPMLEKASANRSFLERALSLDNYNPILLDGPLESQPGRVQAEMKGRTVIYFAAPWRAREFPEDPLACCAFDLVLLSDGALAQLSERQLRGLSIWVRAGGSVCILPDCRLDVRQLNYLRSWFAKGLSESTDLNLDSEGRLVVRTSDPQSVVYSRFGLGRAVLLPAVDDLSEHLSSSTLGRIVAFLWKVRSDQPVWNGQPWKGRDDLRELQEKGLSVHADEHGIYIPAAALDQMRNYLYYGGLTQRGDRFYLSGDFLRRQLNGDGRLQPQADNFSAFVQEMLLPSDIRMIPVPVIASILLAYVLTIGPVDYFVLGWLKMRKYTWVFFPVVTLIYTFITMVVAHRYLSSEHTGGRLEITDLDDGGIPVRRTTIETLFYGGRRDVIRDHTSEMVVQANVLPVVNDWDPWNTPQQIMTTASAPMYTGHFPQKHQFQQRVQQWSPVTLRTLTLEPADDDIPEIDWSDLSLLKTAAGNNRLRLQLEKEAQRRGRMCAAAVLNAYHRQQIVFPDPRQSGEPIAGDGAFTIGDHVGDHVSMPEHLRMRVSQMLGEVPTAATQTSGFHRIVSQISPQGSEVLEDLSFVDISDPHQWALVVIFSDGYHFQVYRKSYREDP